MSAREVVPSPEQTAAILEPGNVLVRAGAGSGKTEVLARRFVALVAGEIAGYSALGPEQIAAITFTEKATYDMRGRIADVLEQRMAQEQGGELHAHLRRARRTLTLARISTIHAFCARLLRENAIEAGLDPEFKVIDEYETATFVTRICEQALVDAVRSGDPGAIYLAGSRRLRQLGFREGALEVTVRIVREARRLGRPPQWVLEQAQHTARLMASERDGVGRLAGELCALVDRLTALRGVGGQTGEALDRLRRAWKRMRVAVSAFSAESDPAASEVLRELIELMPKAQAASVKETVNGIRELLAKSEGFGITGRLIMAWGAQRGLRPTLEVARLIARAAVAVDEACRRERVVTFDDLLVMTRSLLSGESDANARCRRQLRAILVDEYQDTDPIQDEIVGLITRAGEAAPGLYIVGDEKQSIYRFRGADVTVFNRVREPALKRMPLRENRRSTHNILNFVNALGAHVMRAEAAQEGAREAGAARPRYWIEWNDDHRLQPLRSAAPNPPVEVITAVAGGRSMAERRTIEARALAQRILEFIESRTMVGDVRGGAARAASFGDIAMLLRAFTDVAIYERALVEAGIPCYTVKGRGFYGCTEVLDLTELLAAANDPRDSMALAAALRSPFFALSDKSLLEMALRIRERGGNGRGAESLAALFDTPAADFEWLGEGRAAALRAWEVLQDLRSIRTRLSIVEVIERAIALTDFEAVMLGQRQGRQRVANLRKLVELARSFDARGLFTFHDFITYLRQLTAEPPLEAQAQILGEGEDVVRLMTVHQAKGLEFPIVIVGDAGRRDASDYRTPVLDTEYGLLVNDTVGSGGYEIPSASIERYRRRIRDEEKAESVRIMYVALTRARDYLVVSEGPAVGGWAAQIREFVGKELIKNFAASGDQQKEVELGGARIMLERASTGSLEHAAERPPGDGEHLDLAQTRINFSAEATSELVISPTALAAFERCPRQFHFRHGLGLAEGDGIGGANQGGDAAAMGTVAHAVLERLDFGSGRRAIAAEIRGLAETLGAAAGLAPEQCAAIARDVDRYASAVAGSDGATAREVPFFLNLGEGLFVRGQIDVLVDDGRRIIVRDYKYARAADEAHIYQVQMECYALAAASAYPERSVEAEIIFLRDDVARIPITLPPMEEIRARLQRLGRGVIEAGERGEYAKGPSEAALCRTLRCAYISRCWGN